MKESKCKDDLSFIQATIIAMDVERRPLTGTSRDMVSDKLGNINQALTDYTKQTEMLVEFIDVLIEHVEMDELSEVNDIIKDLKVIAGINTILKGGKV
jgi:hypothetical protein